MKYDVELLDRIFGSPWLTPREREIFSLKYQKGLYNYQIAQIMNYCPDTVGRILKRVMLKSAPLIRKYQSEKQTKITPD